MKTKPERRKVERFYALQNNVSVEYAHKVLAHDKKLYKQQTKEMIRCRA